jgi:hypothetical protein
MRQAISAWSRAVERRRRPILVGGLLVSAAVAEAAVLTPAARPVIYGVLGGAFFLIFVGALVIANVLNRRRPRAFEVEAGDVWVSDVWAGDTSAGDVWVGDRVFATPRLGANVLMGLCFVPLLALGAVICGLEIAAGRHLIESWLGIAGAFCFATLALWAAWKGIGVRLTPDNILVDRASGTVIIPWAAVDPERPVVPTDDDFSVRPVLAKPELVTRSGLVSGSTKLSFEGVDQEFVAAVVAHYAAEPERRSAIGTAGELDRLRAALPAADPATEQVLQKGLTRKGLIVHLLIAAGVIAFMSARDYPFWVDQLGSFACFSVGASLAGRLRLGVWFRRRFRRRTT